jgi:DNA-binding XRE family transcriptional regulator
MAKRTLKEIVGKKYDLLAMREKLKLSQQQFAEHIGVAQGTVCRWEQEETAPKVVQLYVAELIAKLPTKPNRKVKKAKRQAIRAKLGALTPVEQEQLNADTNTEA